MKPAVVITTIFSPTETVKRLSETDEWDVIVVGDRRTPSTWSWPGVRFISAAEQETSPFHLARKLPWNHYARKMIGYLAAMESGAGFIAETDDDNRPMGTWSFPPFEGTFESTPPDQGFINIYRLFTEQDIWPRGFPLNRIKDGAAIPHPRSLFHRDHRIGIWQGLADGDPDVDAIYRLTANVPCRFAERNPVVLETGTAAPLNSQNTAFSREAFPLLYLPGTVNFRVTDILRGYVAQPVLWAAGLRVGFTGPTVFQERNDHDFLKDFESELPLYLHAERFFSTAAGAVRRNRPITDNLFNAYEAFARDGWVEKSELDILSAWLKDLADIGKV